MQLCIYHSKIWQHFIFVWILHQVWLNKLIFLLFVVRICVLVGYLQDIFLHKIELTFQFLVIIENFPFFSSFTIWSHALPLLHFSLLALLESCLFHSNTVMMFSFWFDRSPTNKYLKTVVASHFMVGRWKHPQTWVNILSEAAFPYCNLTTNKTLPKMCPEPNLFPCTLINIHIYTIFQMFKY